jgi:hypothetical protein
MSCQLHFYNLQSNETYWATGTFPAHSGEKTRIVQLNDAFLVKVVKVALIIFNPPVLVNKIGKLKVNTKDCEAIISCFVSIPFLISLLAPILSIDAKITGLIFLPTDLPLHVG